MNIRALIRNIFFAAVIAALCTSCGIIRRQTSEQAELKERLSEVVIDELHFEQTYLRESFIYISDLYNAIAEDMDYEKRYHVEESDPNDPFAAPETRVEYPQGKPVNIILAPTTRRTAGEKLVSVRARNVSALEAITEVAKAAKLKCRIEDNWVYVGKKYKAPKVKTRRGGKAMEKRLRSIMISGLGVYDMRIDDALQILCDHFAMYEKPDPEAGELREPILFIARLDGDVRGFRSDCNRHAEDPFAERDFENEDEQAAEPEWEDEDPFADPNSDDDSFETEDDPFAQPEDYDPFGDMEDDDSDEFGDDFAEQELPEDYDPTKLVTLDLYRVSLYDVLQMMSQTTTYKFAVTRDGVEVSE